MSTSSDQDWLIESLRGTFFTAVSPHLAVREWWSLVSGTTSDALVVNEGPSGYAAAQAEIDDATALLQVVCQPGRIDWNYAIGFQAPDPTGKITTLRSIPAQQGLEEFWRRLRPWMEIAPECNRLAVGCNARYPVASKEEGYVRLQNFLHNVRIDPTGSSDFLYQINRPRPATSVNFPLKINRLSKWQVVTPYFALGAVPLGPVASLSPSQLVASNPSHQCRVELDVNTAADNSQVLDRVTLQRLSQEMVGIAGEILRQGDRP
jgi:hypothetical protein